MNLGQRLRELRERKGLSIYDVEREVRLHFSTISKYERNERQPSLDVLRELAAVYGVPLSSLFVETNELRELLPANEVEWLDSLRQNETLAELLGLARELSPFRLRALVDFLRPDQLHGSDVTYPQDPA